MKVNNLKRIIKEDFEKEYQSLIDKISFVYNPLVEQLISVLDHGVDFDNLNRQYSQISVTVDGAGIPSPALEIKYGLKTKLKGINIIFVQNTTDSSPLNGAPFLTYTTDGSIIKVTQITGLVPNKKYNMSLELIG